MTGPPHAIYALIKLMWAQSSNAEAIAHLRDLITDLRIELGLPPMPTPSTEGQVASRAALHPKTASLLGKCYRRMGNWLSVAAFDGSSADVSRVHSFDVIP